LRQKSSINFNKCQWEIRIYYAIEMEPDRSSVHIISLFVIMCTYKKMTIEGNHTVQMQGPHKLDCCTKPQIANAGLDEMLAGVEKP